MVYIRRKIFQQSMTIALILGVLVAFTVIPPLYIKLNKQKNQEVEYILKNRALIIESILDQMIETAGLFTSRSTLRDQLVAYNNNQITLNELREHGIPKLTDGLNKSKIAIGIRRISIDKKPLIEAGEKLPVTNNHLKDEAEILDTLDTHITLRAPIHNKVGEIIGYDEILLNENILLQAIKNPSGLYQTGEIVLLRYKDNLPVPFFAPNSNYSLPSQILQTGAQITVDDKYVVGTIKLAFNGFYLLIRIPKGELTLSIKQYVLNIILATIFIAILTIPLAYWLVSPLVERLTKEFKQREQIENRLRELNSNLEKTIEKEILKRREHEHILVHQARVVQMSKLINSIAHQWRQPLNALALIIQDIKDAKRYQELNNEYIARITSESMSIINSMSKTIDNFSNFYRTDKIKTNIDLVALVNQTLQIQQTGQSMHNINISVNSNTKHIPFNGYKNELKQFIQTLVNNARDAISERNISNPSITITLTKEDEQITISVEDNAGGVNPAIEDKIFDPYFTTKEQGKGVGLELYIAKIIIEEHMDGKLIHRNTDNGALFIATLPNPS